jgi:ribosome maturation factor RimP
MSLESDIRSMVESIGLKLYDTSIVTEGGEVIYRVSVTSANGVSMDDCVEATKLISPLLDVTPPVKDEYRLEVSSPGIERRLRTLDNFKNSIGEKVKIQTFDKEKLRGMIVSVDGASVTIKTSEGERSLDFGQISKASTYFEW